jgi:hypothetical protein
MDRGRNSGAATDGDKLWEKVERDTGEIELEY